MKKITLLSTFCFLLLTLVVNAQTPPNAFNYSAVARNAAGQPIATTTIGIQITILKTSPTGASQYSENHFVNTDAFGLFNLVIGAGALQSGSMATIDWSNDNYYLKVGLDATGGTNFITMGTTQLLSVPYALYAKSAGSVSGSINSGIYNFDFPDGVDGESIIINANSTYTVPLGKNLYNFNSQCKIGSDTLYGGATVIPETTVISNTLAWSAPESCILVNNTTQAIIWHSWNTYTVPPGLKFYTKIPCGNAQGCTLLINGVPFTNLFDEWQIFSSGTTLQLIVDQGQYNYLVTGYLK